MLFTVPKKRRRPLGLLISLLGHWGLVYLLSLTAPDASGNQVALLERKYTVLLLQLDNPPDVPSGQEEPVRTSVSGDHGQARRADGADSQSSTVLRPFVLRPFPHTDPVTQTIVRLDVPPEIHLDREVPLPAVLMRSGVAPIRAFVAPTAPGASATPKPALELPSAPQLPGIDSAIDTTGPNLAALLRGDRLPTRAFVEPMASTDTSKGFKPAAEIAHAPEITTFDPVVIMVPSLAGVLRSDRLPLRAFAAPPSSSTSPAALQVAADLPVAPQFVGANSPLRITDVNLAALLGNDRLPVRAFHPLPQATAGKSSGTQTLASPPQIAPPDLRASSVIGLLSLPNVPVYAAVAAIPPANQIAALVPTGPGAGSGFAGALVSNDLAPTQSAGGSREDLPLPGTTQLNFPKDGKFGAVVLGSSAAAPYIESVGALSGKFVYSAFISVGLPQKWILQYSVSKTDEQKLAEKGRAEALEAPWPYTIVRPDHIDAGTTNYILIRGVLTAEGTFDHLSLLFPMELDSPDLLMRALKHWNFRAARRDGEPTQVDVLLIIPTVPK